MDWYSTVFLLIDMRSFSSLWYWIILAVVWSAAASHVLGVPHDMISRARRGQPTARADLETLVRITSARTIHIADVSGIWMIGLGFFALTALAMLGFVYGQEFSQALFLIALPMGLVGFMRVRVARRSRGLTGDALVRLLARHRLSIQIIGMIAILITAFWGMWYNINTNILG